MARTKETIRKELEETRERLALYRQREKDMIGAEGVQMYTIGSRSLQRYQTSLSSIQDMIEKLKKRERELEAEMRGQAPRRALGVVPRDW